jgi:hypothetical protein
VTDQPPKPSVPPASDEGAPSERPTVNPPFDVEAFARAASGPSEQAETAADAPTRRPPPLNAPLASLAGEADPPFERVTLTDEIETGKARVRSTLRDPPRSFTSGALSIANARAPSAPLLHAQPKVAGAPDRRDDSAAPSSIEAAVLGAVDGSTAPEITERTIDDPVAEMRERFSLGDYTGALEIAELILAEDPDDVEAAGCVDSCRSVLETMYGARLGPLDRVPTVTVPRAQMRWLSMDHRAGFILSLIDGSSTIEMILDVCGMPKLDALRILQDLVHQKIVAVR